MSYFTLILGIQLYTRLLKTKNKRAR